MNNIKVTSRKYHKILGIIFALPLLYSALTAVLFSIAENVFHKAAFAEYIIKFHTLEIVGLENIYPFVVLTGVIGLVFTGSIMAKKKRI